MTTTAEYNKNIAGPITGCPVCGSAVYDNTAPGAKKNPKGPDYKCKANGDHAFWIKRTAGAPKQSYDAGAVMPWETPAEAAQVAPPVSIANVSGNPAQTNVVGAVDPLTASFQLYGRCLGHVLATVAPVLNSSDVGTTPEAIIAATATLFIQASQRGLKA